MKTSRLRVAGDFPEFIVTNKSGITYKVKLDPHGNGSCTCPDFQVRIAQEGRICKHIAAAAITKLAPQAKTSSPANANGSVRANEAATAEVSPLIFRIRRLAPLGAVWQPPRPLALEAAPVLAGTVVDCNTEPVSRFLRIAGRYRIGASLYQRCPSREHSPSPWTSDAAICVDPFRGEPDCSADALWNHALLLTSMLNLQASDIGPDRFAGLSETPGRAAAA